MYRARTAFRVSIVLACLLLAAVSAPAWGAGPTEDALQRLEDATGGRAKVSMSQTTGVAKFVRLPADARNKALVGGRSFEARAEAFFGEYGAMFGIEDPKRDLMFVGKKPGNVMTHVSYQQVYQGVPVFAGVLRAHFNRAGRLAAVNGNFVPELQLDTTPTWTAPAAERVAIRAVRKSHPEPELFAADSHLYIFRAGLLQGVEGRNHLVYEVEVVNEARTVREFVYVDAHFGKVVDQITGIHDAHAFHREVYEGSLSNLVWTEGDPFPTGNTDWDNEIYGAGETYNVFASMTNGAYLSYDGSNAHMLTVNNDPTINCPNANWNGTSTNYCTGVTGDDTVAHEWGHAYTEFTNNLIYQWQSGALNESYSDIWGEVIDFENGRGTDAPGGLRAADGSNCSKFGDGPKRKDNTYRWLSGEDDTAFGGAIRDMWRPLCYGDPGEVTASQYWCTTGDSGGVHTNSGIPNHAFALIVDGGTYNGQTITGIGLNKTARIHWEAQNLLTPASDFVDHADALETACAALDAGNDVIYTLDAFSPTGVDSGERVDAADCTEVADAIAATELRTEPTQCNFQPLLDPNAPALCGGGTVTTVDLQDWETGLGGWTVSNVPVNPPTFDTPDWAVVGSLPASEPGSAAFVADLAIGDCVSDIEAGVLRLDSPVITLPASPPTAAIAFDHYVATELTWDGGNVKVSVNGGGFTLVPSSAYTFNAYNSSLETAANGNDNPMAGQAAFTGTDGGSPVGSWGQSQIDLTGIAAASDDIEIRFEMGLDGCNGIDGWYVDEVRVHTCSAPPCVPPGQGQPCDANTICCSGVGNCTGGKPSSRVCQ